MTMSHHRFVTLFFLTQFGILLVLLLFTATFLLNNSISVDEELGQVAIFLSTGILLGIICGSGLLVTDYMKKNWDMHNITTKFLIRFSLLFAVTSIVSLGFLRAQFGFAIVLGNLGFLFGGSFCLVAYSSEIQKEH